MKLKQLFENEKKLQDQKNQIFFELNRYFENLKYGLLNIDSNDKITYQGNLIAKSNISIDKIPIKINEVTGHLKIRGVSSFINMPDQVDHLVIDKCAVRDLTSLPPIQIMNKFKHINGIIGDSLKGVVLSETPLVSLEGIENLKVDSDQKLDIHLFFCAELDWDPYDDAKKYNARIFYHGDDWPTETALLKTTLFQDESNVFFKRSYMTSSSARYDRLENILRKYRNKGRTAVFSLSRELKGAGFESHATIKE
jgi:hypothetical protein